MKMRFQPKMKVETPDGVGVIKFCRNAAPDFKEIEKVVCDVEGVDREYSPDSVKLLDEQPPVTVREPKKAKPIRLNVAFQNADGSLLPKSEFLAIMAGEYDRIKDEVFGGNYEEIEKHVLAAFAKHKGVRLNLGFLESAVVKGAQAEAGERDLTVDEWAKLGKRFRDYMKSNTGEQGAGAIYGKRPGPNGGHFTWTDYVEEKKA